MTSKIIVAHTLRSLLALPHRFEFTPDESLVVRPFVPGVPQVRPNLPTSQTARDDMWACLEGPFASHARPDAVVAIICLPEDRAAAELTSEDLRPPLDSERVRCPVGRRRLLV